MSDRHSDDAGCSGLVHVSPLPTEVSGAVQTDHDLQIFFCSNSCVTTRSGAEGSGWSLTNDGSSQVWSSETDTGSSSLLPGKLWQSGSTLRGPVHQCTQWASVCRCACMRACVQWTWLLWKLSVLRSLQPSPDFFSISFLWAAGRAAHACARAMPHRW